jgi:hypothetical protein
MNIFAFKSDYKKEINLQNKIPKEYPKQQKIKNIADLD